MTSVENIPRWIDFIREAGKKDIKIYVIGNKYDLQSEILNETRKNAREIAEKQAQQYHEVSAKSGFNIEDLFNRVIDDLQANNSKKKESAVEKTCAAQIPSESGSKSEKQGGKGTVKLNSSVAAKKEGGQWSNCCQK